MRESEHEYAIMWNQEDILDLIDLTAHEQQELVWILSGDPAANHTSNPLRDMVVQSVLDRDNSREIWRFASLLTAQEICDEWEVSSESVMNEVRSVGELIYNTIGKKVKC
jgi:hypothetical protein